MSTEREKLLQGLQGLQRFGQQNEALRKALHPTPEMDALARHMSDIASQFKMPKGLVETFDEIDAFSKQIRGLSDLALLPDISSLNAVSKAIGDSARFQMPQFNISLPDVANFLPKFGLEALKIDPHLSRSLFEITEKTAAIQAQFAKTAELYRELSKTFFQNDYMDWFLEEERAVGLIEGLGLVPHGALWAHITGDETLDEGQHEAFAVELATRVWPDLRPRLLLAQSDCLGDARLATMYTQLLDAHEARLFENVAGASVGIIERTVFLARSVIGGSSRTFNWLEDEIGKLTSDYLDYREFRVWSVLMTHVFASCYSDSEADNNKYPNRHAVAHGIGSEVATVIDSLNAILLAHFVITAASAVLAFHRDNSGASLTC